MQVYWIYMAFFLLVTKLEILNFSRLDYKQSWRSGELLQAVIFHLRSSIL